MENVGETVGDSEARKEGEVAVLAKRIEDIDILSDDGLARRLDVMNGVGLLPPAIQKRIRALRKNQADIISIEAGFFKDIHELEMKYSKKYDEEYEKRHEIIVGLREPSEEESNFQIGTVLELPDGRLFGEAPENAETTEKEEEFVGIPLFWLNTLQSAQPVASLVEEVDLPILQHLTDVRCKNRIEPLGFDLNFHFSPNDYFTNSMLTKSYEMKNEPKPEDPLSYDGPEIITCKGCTIDWKAGKDTTKVVVERRQKHKRTGNIRTITKTENRDSFFNFFNPPNPPEQDEQTSDETYDEIVEILNEDFEIGEALRERIIPRAVLYYTGEALEDESELETDSEEEEGDEEEDEGNQSQESEISQQGDGK